VLDGALVVPAVIPLFVAEQADKMDVATKTDRAPTASFSAKFRSPSHPGVIAAPSISAIGVI
jgi:hypothetical protein